ncbi:hypothetical protein KSC_102800 [Ktedonobacter sp. SOSP1-52]|nr:hypothetical protein KSC_102800 [Ktedonobacter sp. SOSP1-52]
MKRGNQSGEIDLGYESKPNVSHRSDGCPMVLYQSVDPSSQAGRKTQNPTMRAVVNAILYVVVTGC